MQAETDRQYYPENWKPLERWLSLAALPQNVFLDVERARVRMLSIPADFAQHFERCTGTAYTDDFTEAAQHAVALELEEDDDDEDDHAEEDYLPAVHPPNGESLSRLVQRWASAHKVDPVKVQPLLSELMMYKNGLIAEQEEQCRIFLKTTQCWLK